MKIKHWFRLVLKVIFENQLPGNCKNCDKAVPTLYASLLGKLVFNRWQRASRVSVSEDSLESKLRRVANCWTLRDPIADDKFVRMKTVRFWRISIKKRNRVTKQLEARTCPEKWQNCSMLISVVWETKSFFEKC